MYHHFTPRLTAADIRWVVPPAEPRMTSRAWRKVDRKVGQQLREVDACLSAWAGHQPKTEAIDRLLDERLGLRPPDVMDTARRQP
jgi:hypothetical protein